MEPRDKELHEEFKRRGDKLHDTLLKEVEDLGCDRFAVQHDPYNDPIMRSSFQFIDKEERLNKAYRKQKIDLKTWLYIM